MSDRLPAALTDHHPVTRADALARLTQFVPHAGADYAARRNLDQGPGRHDVVSRLSAALARRTVTEAEVLAPVVARHGEPSRRLCNKDPFTLKSGTYLKQLFPKSKFLFMVRDGRATVHSIITRKVTITGFDLKSYRQSLTKWNGAITAMNDQCDELGPEYCLKVYYEQLVRNVEFAVVANGIFFDNWL